MTEPRTHRAPRKSVGLMLGIAIALLGVVPSAAMAKGWTYRVNNQFNGASTKSTGKHCGPTKFGKWSFRATMTVGNESAHIRFKTKITKDGRLNRPHGLKITGDAPASAEAAIRRSFRITRYRYASGQLITQTVNGVTLATAKFRPKSSKRC